MTSEQRRPTVPRLVTCEQSKLQAVASAQETNQAWKVETMSGSSRNTVRPNKGSVKCTGVGDWAVTGQPVKRAFQGLR